MTNHYLKWCPNECGKCVKQVIRNQSNKSKPNDYIYQCTRCNTLFNFTDLMDMNPYMIKLLERKKRLKNVNKKR